MALAISAKPRLSSLCAECALKSGCGITKVKAHQQAHVLGWDRKALGRTWADIQAKMLSERAADYEAMERVWKDLKKRLNNVH